MVDAEDMKLMTLEKTADIEKATAIGDALRSGVLCITCDDSVISVPDDIAKLVMGIVDSWAGGSTVTLVAHKDMLTTQQVADFMQVSRPFVISMIDRGVLACVRVGKHRRVSAASVVEYMEQSRQEGLAGIADEARQNVADNLY